MAITNIASFDDTFQEIIADLNVKGNDYDLNHFYINFQNEKEELETSEEELNCSYHRSQQNQQIKSQSQAISTSIKNRNQKDHSEFFYEIPEYLLISNTDFIVQFFNEIHSYFQPIHFEDIQTLSMLTYQMSIIRLHQQFWDCCLKSGTRQIERSELTSFILESPLKNNETNEISFSYWPDIVTSIMILHGIIHTNNKNQIEQDIYINFVQNYLHQLDEKFNEYKLKFDTIKKSLPTIYENTFYDKIEHFVQKHDVLLIRLYFHIRIALIKYQYLDQLNQFEYLKQNPNNLQLEIAKEICTLTYEKEKAIQECFIYKNDIFFQELPKSLEILENSIPTCITTLSDQTIRDRLSRQYQKIMEQTKYDLQQLLTRATAEKKSDCEKIFDRKIADIWKHQRELPLSERLTTTMITLIEQRQKNIIKCLQSIYDLKSDFLKQASMFKPIK